MLDNNVMQELEYGKCSSLVVTLPKLKSTERLWTLYTLESHERIELFSWKANIDLLKQWRCVFPLLSSDCMTAFLKSFQG